MTGVEGSITTDIAFWAASVLAIVAAVMVVTLRDVFKAALFLAASFLAVAALYVLLRAEFLAAVQVLIYVGAISILIIFAIMLVRDVPGGNRDNRLVPIAATVAALVGAVVIIAAFNSDFTDQDALVRENPDVAAGLTGTYNTVEKQGAEGDLAKTRVVAPAPGETGSETGVFVDATGKIGGLLVRDFVLPFEAVSVVLLAALIGALALIRERQSQ